MAMMLPDWKPQGDAPFAGKGHDDDAPVYWETATIMCAGRPMMMPLSAEYTNILQ